jgi:hypothetical protein
MINWNFSAPSAYLAVALDKRGFCFLENVEKD